MKDKRLEVLDLKSAAVRETIQQAGDAVQLYLSDAATVSEPSVVGPS